jgi:hypothetical protein
VKNVNLQSPILTQNTTFVICGLEPLCRLIQSISATVSHFIKVSMWPNRCYQRPLDAKDFFKSNINRLRSHFSSFSCFSSNLIQNAIFRVKKKDILIRFARFACFGRKIMSNLTGHEKSKIDFCIIQWVLSPRVTRPHENPKSMCIRTFLWMCRYCTVSKAASTSGYQLWSVCVDCISSREN